MLKKPTGNKEIAHYHEDTKAWYEFRLVERYCGELLECEGCGTRIRVFFASDLQDIAIPQNSSA